MSSPLNKSLSWETRQAQLQKINHWILDGAIGLKTNNTHFNASIHWIQDKKNYTFHIFGPFNTGSAILEGDAKQISLKTTNGEYFSAISPEILLQDYLGWQIPISNLKYWIRGLPTPNEPILSIQYDEFHHIITLQQGNWVITFNNYTAHKEFDLPRQITLNHPNFRIRIAIRRWQF